MAPHPKVQHRRRNVNSQIFYMPYQNSAFGAREVELYWWGRTISFDRAMSFAFVSEQRHQHLVSYPDWTVACTFFSPEPFEERPHQACYNKSVSSILYPQIWNTTLLLDSLCSQWIGSWILTKMSHSVLLHTTQVLELLAFDCHFDQETLILCNQFIRYGYEWSRK